MNEIIKNFIAKKYGLKSGRLLISDYYDALRSDIDIHTEEILKRATQFKKLKTPIDLSSLNKTPPKEEIGLLELIENKMLNYDLKDPYENKYAYEWTKPDRLVNVEDYVNGVRRETLDELKKAEKKAYAVFDQQQRIFANQPKVPLDKALVEEFWEKLCSESFAFLLAFGSHDEFDFFKQNRLKIFTVITDFYLSSSQIEWIK